MARMQKRHLTTLFATSMLIACSGGGEKADEVPTDDTAGGLLAQCQNASEVAKKQAEMFQNVSTGSREAMEAAYVDFQRVVTKWEADDNPCAKEGANVTDRMALQQSTSAALTEAESVGTTKIVRHIEPNIDESRELLKTIFGSGREQSDDVVNAAVAVDRRYRQRLLTAFREQKKYGQLDGEMKTTCVFGKAAIDPNAEEITENFESVFNGKTEVHALCRIPLPADKFAGDPEGKFVLVLDDDDDPSNGVLHEGDLGSPEKWKNTQWFSGRFSIPQGEPARADSGYYYVRVRADRPELGDEQLVHNWFYWYQ